MKLRIENFGPITNAELECGKLTLICGKNNTGKTYLTYTMYALLHIIKNEMSIKLPQKDINTLVDSAYLVINLDDYVQKYIQAVQECKETLQQRLPTVFAKYPDKCKYVVADIILSQSEVLQQIHNGNKESSIVMQVSSNCKLIMMRNENSSRIKITMQNTGENLPYLDALQYSLQRLVVQAFNSGTDSLIFPKPFIITCERTGIAIFSNDIAMAAMYKSSSSSSSSVTPYDLYRGTNIWDFDNRINGYQLSVEMDLRFVLDLRKVVNKKSYIAQEYSDILDLFEEIAGGKYIFDERTNQVLFIPKGSKEKLAMHEASSTVRSLMEMYFYLNHLSAPQQMLIFDEPEQNLHPENQRKLARLLARLVNLGISVLVTTHSDYIIKEFNTLLMLNYDDSRMQQLRGKYEYSEKELLKAEQVRVYCLENGMTIEKTVSQDVGVAVDSFDESIRLMGIIQRDILYGGRK